MVSVSSVDCGEAPTIADADMSWYQSGYGDLANYTCRLGSHFPDMAAASTDIVITAVCESTGQWHNVPSGCTRMYYLSFNGVF